MYICVEDVPPEYWEILAERRQDALNDSIKENEEVETTLNFRFALILFFWLWELVLFNLLKVNTN